MGFTLSIVFDAVGNFNEIGIPPMMTSKKLEISREFSCALTTIVEILKNE